MFCRCDNCFPSLRWDRAAPSLNLASCGRRPSEGASETCKCFCRTWPMVRVTLQLAAPNLGSCESAGLSSAQADLFACYRFLPPYPLPAMDGESQTTLHDFLQDRPRLVRDDAEQTAPHQRLVVAMPCLWGRTFCQIKCTEVKTAMQRDAPEVAWMMHQLKMDGPSYAAAWRQGFFVTHARV